MRPLLPTIALLAAGTASAASAAPCGKVCLEGIGTQYRAAYLAHAPKRAALVAGGGAAGRSTSEASGTERSGEADGDVVLAEVLNKARQQYDLSGRRLDVLGGGMIADPSWNILLDLFISDLTGRRISVSAVCIGSMTLVGCMPARTIFAPEPSRTYSTSLFSRCARFQISTSMPPRMTPTRIVESRLCAALL